ncbi:hypothetical protein GCM10017083_15360 [Thalassobaculum fulvum]|uniref:Uncharacterized protein n=1 Tax=Thalassobaculum fulvum TaxID=1633335 RepID=A0A918XQJ5_9PROT|nr:hypothetical protein [Thalassobaculum fulvum]GHD46344.1 hypothetical protein GCM10017083_15360 [Thalassobaculum fulvum]
MLDWEGLFKRYVWDDRTTPYLVPVARLNRRQADSEILAYSLFMGVLFSVVALGAMSEMTPLGRSPVAGFYAFTVVCACLLLHYTKAVPAALYLGTAPLVGLGYVAVAGRNAGRDPIDSAIVAAILIVLAWYSLRLVNLARRYPNLPESDAAPPRRRLFK